MLKDFTTGRVYLCGSLHDKTWSNNINEIRRKYIKVTYFSNAIF